MPWRRPEYTGLAGIHRPRPSFIEPPTDLKRAELPAELANPGSVAHAEYIEPTSGNKVVTASNRVVENARTATNDDYEIQPTQDAALLIQPPRPTRPTRTKRSNRQRTAQHVARRQIEADVFDDLDLQDTPAESDVDVFGDDRSDENSSDLDILGSPDSADDLLSADDLSADDLSADDLGSDLLDEAPNGSTANESENDIFADDLQAEESDRNANEATNELPKDDLQELPSPPDADLQDSVDDTDDVGPIRRPESSAEAMAEDKPADLSVYNRRNCPEEIEVFEAAWKAFHDRPISAISLDITPEFEPNEVYETMIEKRDQTLAAAPSREWRDLFGQPLASGKMKDFRNGRVVVETESGQTKELPFHSLSSSDLCFVSSWWGIPSEFQPNVGKYEVRNFTTQTFTWKASGLCHKPLYFEEVQLERYGHSAGPVKQTMLSGVHFFGNILFLPYKMGVNPPNECQYALGYYRPGDCAPWLLHAVPISLRGAALQTGAMLGGVALVP